MFHCRVRRTGRRPLVPVVATRLRGRAVSNFFSPLGYHRIMLRQIDSLLQNAFGLPYLRVARDAYIHERLAWMVQQARRVAATQVLDAGCGSGMALRYLYARCPDVRRYVGIDLRASRLAARYRDIPLTHDFHDVQLDDDWDVGIFDFVFYAETLEHLTDDVGALRKLARAAPGGHIAVTMPSLPFVLAMKERVPVLGRHSATQDGGHVRYGYDVASLQKLAGAAGLSVISVEAISPTGYWRAKTRHGRCPLLSNIAGSTASAPADDDTLRTHASIAALLAV
jgi:SAM-dependent methyltransferase